MFYRLRLLHLTSPRGVALRNRGQDTIQPPLTGSASVRQRPSGQYVLRNRRDVNPRVHVSSRVGLEELHLPEKPPQGDAKITCSESPTTPSKSSLSSSSSPRHWPRLPDGITLLLHPPRPGLRAPGSCMGTSPISRPSTELTAHNGIVRWPAAIKDFPCRAGDMVAKHRRICVSGQAKT